MSAPLPNPFSRTNGRAHPEDVVTFDRRELALILPLYGRMVAAGEWRDYSLSFLRDAAIFAIYRRSSETPLFRIEKRPKLRDRQGIYALIGMDGQVLKRGHELAPVLSPLRRKAIHAI